jgi:hypothetical protein
MAESTRLIVVDDSDPLIHYSGSMVGSGVLSELQTGTELRFNFTGVV